MIEFLDRIDLSMLYEGISAAKALAFVLLIAGLVVLVILARRTRLEKMPFAVWAGRTAVLVALYYLLGLGLRQVFDTVPEDGGLGIVALAHLAGLLLVGAFFVNEAVRFYYWERRFTARHGQPPGILTAMGDGLTYLIAVYMIFSVLLDQTVTGLLVSSTIVAGVVGLAMQSTLSDLVAGVALSIDRPFSVGDFVELDDGTLGEIVDINWRACHIRSYNASYYVIPNARLSNARVHNYSRPTQEYKTNVVVHVDAAVPPDMVRRVLLQAALDAPRVSKNPPPNVVITDVGRTIAYKIFLTAPSFDDHWDTETEVYQMIWRHFAAHGIQMAAPAEEAVLRRAEPSTPDWPSPETLFADVPILNLLSAAERSALFARARSRHFDIGEHIVEAGQEGSSMFVLAYGLFGITITTPGGDKIEVARLGAGQYFGEMSLLADQPRSADVTARTSTQVFVIERDAIQPHFDAHPDLMERVAEQVAERVAANAKAAGRESETSDSIAGKLFGTMRKLFGGLPA